MQSAVDGWQLQIKAIFITFLISVGAYMNSFIKVIVYFVLINSVCSPPPPHTHTRTIMLIVRMVVSM